MKQVFIRAFVIIGSALLLFACSKANADLNQGTNNPSKSGKAITISATLTDALTKVSFTPEGSSTPKMALAWESGDKLRVANHNDHSSYEDFDLVDGATTKVGVFQGTPPVSASSYDIWVLHQGSEFNSGATQTQAREGDTRHIQYVAQANNVTDLNAVVFSDISSVLGLKAKLPSGVATKITSVELIASNNIFFSGNTLTINLTDASGAADDVLNLYATLPSGNKAIPDGTTLLVKFNSSNTDHTVYTRYVEFPDGKSFASGCLNHLQINAANSALYANASSTEIGQSTNPYLIADKYQLLEVYNELADDDTKYFKMVDNVNMNGAIWKRLNDTEVGSSTWPKGIDFNGNGKSISYLNNSFIYVLQGSVYDLTLDHCTVNASSGKGGILACYIKVANNAVTNVDITNSSITGTSTNAALIGQIDGDKDSEYVAISGCDITDTDVTGGGITGGVIGYANAKISVSSCSYSGGTVTVKGRFGGGFVGSTLNSVSTYTDCHVTNATIDFSQATLTNDGRFGGFVGQLQSNNVVKGCTVGTSEKKVLVKLGTPYLGKDNAVGGSGDNADKPLNAGGFVGVNYGTVTKNGENNSKAYVQITSTNTYGTPLNVGGFAGYQQSTVEYSDAVVDMSTLEGQYIGGFAGTTPHNSARIDHCSVSGSVKGNNYTGMFIGGMSNSATITNNTASGEVVGQSSVGGFVGYCAGKPTFQDNSTSANVSSRGSNVGGFVGAVDEANFTRCSASGNVTKTSGTSNVYGGFAGYTSKAILENCYSTGTLDVDGAQTEYVGGFIGQVNPATSNLVDIDNCYSESDIEGAGRWIGGFIGYIYKAADNCGNVEITKCHASGNVTVTGGKSYVAGFIGRTYMVSGTHLTIEKCYASGDVTSDGAYTSAFLGEIGEATACTISDCYSAGNISGSNQQRGGLIAAINANANTSATISRCYTSGAVVGSFRLGGLIGNINNGNVTVEHCAAWNTEVTAGSGTIGTSNWSSGAVVGTAYPSCTLTDNYRKPGMQVKAFWGNVTGYTFELASDYQHANVDGSDPSTYLVVKDKTTGAEAPSTTATLSGGNYPIFPYHGKVDASKTLSELAQSTLGWSNTVWTFSGELPTLIP